MSLLERACSIAEIAYTNRTDMYGEPYFEHAVRIMYAGRNKNEKIAGVLHDVLRDSEWSIEDLHREGFPEAVTAALLALIRREGEEDEDYFKRIARNRVAAAVMLNKLADEMNVRRMEIVGESEAEWLNECLALYRLLEARTPKRESYIQKARERDRNAYRPWTKELNQELERRYCEETPLKELSERFGRSDGSIRSQIQKLELPEKYGDLLGLFPED